MISFFEGTGESEQSIQSDQFEKVVVCPEMTGNSVKIALNQQIWKSCFAYYRCVFGIYILSIENMYTFLEVAGKSE
jgi:hypothetical protein